MPTSAPSTNHDTVGERVDTCSGTTWFFAGTVMITPSQGQVITLIPGVP